MREGKEPLKITERPFIAHRNEDLRDLGMTDILLPILIVGGLALLGGLILAVSSMFMTVPVDEREKKIRMVTRRSTCIFVMTNVRIWKSIRRIREN